MQWLGRFSKLNDNAPLAEFQAKYSFLGLPAMPQLSAEENRQRYMMSYELGWLVISAFALGVVTAVAYFIFILGLSNIRFNGESILFYIWPCNKSISLQYATQSNQSSDDISMFATVMSIANMIWFIWIIFRVWLEFRHRWTYSSSKSTPIIIFMFLISVTLLIEACSGFFYNDFLLFKAGDSLWGVSVSDSIYVALIYKLFFISLGYFSFGFALIFAGAALRAARRS